MALEIKRDPEILRRSRDAARWRHHRLNPTANSCSTYDPNDEPSNAMALFVILLVLGIAVLFGFLIGVNWP